LRLLVYPHDLTIGGSQINAIDLAAAVSAAGHDVVVYGVPGPLVEYVRERGLRFIAARRTRYRPAPAHIAQLARIASRERIDLIHCYEWPPCLDAFFGAALIGRVPLVCTVLSMHVPPYLPAGVPLIMGTEELGRKARGVQRDDVWVIEPPIDVERDAPTIDGTPFRREHGVEASELLIVSVSRLAIDLKLDALVRAIDAVDLLAARWPLKLALVGDGPAMGALSTRAERVNRRHGREVIILAGAAHDPRTAYAAADVVVGMGSSALRALSIGRPVVVQGEGGFSERFELANVPLFLEQGFYGVGDDTADPLHLARQIEPLLASADLRRTLGDFGRRFVVERFSLERAAQLQMEIYRRVLDAPRRPRLGDALRSARRALALEIENHEPRTKRRKSLRETRLLAQASEGSWPPSMASGLQRL
jgi:glycosyltransferase involved in cell wall biosynthesis